MHSLPYTRRKYLRHVHFHQPMVVKMDGKKKLGVVLMPEE